MHIFRFQQVENADKSIARHLHTVFNGAVLDSILTWKVEFLGVKTQQYHIVLIKNLENEKVKSKKLKEPTINSFLLFNF